jgi:hypothetical protein
MSIANIITQPRDITLQKFNLSQVLQNDRVMTVEMTIDITVKTLTGRHVALKPGREVTIEKSKLD